AQTLIDSTIDSYYVAASYNQTSLSGTVTPTLRVPRATTWYHANDPNGFQMTLDAEAAAMAAGFNLGLYDREIVALDAPSTIAVYCGGLTTVGAKSAIINSCLYDTIVAHELGHSYGLYHANAWASSNDSIFGPGSNNEYGNPFDVMGGCGGLFPWCHFNAR